MALVPTQGIAAVKGIGERKAALYHKLGIETVEQLVLHFPRDYLDLTRVADLERCELGSAQLVRARVVAKSGEKRIRKGMSLFKVRAESDGMPLELTFYNTKYTVDGLLLDEEYLFYGVVNGTLLRREMSAPTVLPLSLEGGWLPIYPTTAGLSSRVIGRDIAHALESLGDLPEPLPAWVLERFSLPSLKTALLDIHCPTDLDRRDDARRRAAFGELLVFSAAMLTLRGRREKIAAPVMTDADPRPLLASLPFALTRGQQDALGDILRDLTVGRAMNRLVQGDVGSGKTVVAALAAYCVHKSGYQTALMAPTELLAEQHATTLSALLAPHDMTVELMTGSMRAKARREAAERLQSGQAHLVVGTHALLSEGTTFARLGLVITDEQHRFGVAQRAALAAKGEQGVHTLVMSATPIPRTLSLILYGDLDVSVIAERPPGRSPVDTYRIDSPRRERAYGFVRKLLDEGRQAYAVCPLVEEGEEAPEGLVPATQYAKQLAEGPFSAYQVGLLHGRMKPRDKEAVMGRFVRGEIQLLVATTVVEVGVDVPNAAVMLIENAERFGLSQLHQLRGRVGRGAHQSHCILVSDAKNPLTLQRLKAVCSTNDGFALAEEDLRLRGPGDFLGVRQHGVPGLSSAELLLDAAVLSQAREAATLLLQADPALQTPENAGVRRAVEQLIERVGTTPN